MGICNCKYPLSQVLEACQVQGVGILRGELLGLILEKEKIYLPKNKGEIGIISAKNWLIFFPFFID